jgi:hypothetical protein
MIMVAGVGDFGFEGVNVYSAIRQARTQLLDEVAELRLNIGRARIEGHFRISGNDASRGMIRLSTKVRA